MKIINLYLKKKNNYRYKYKFWRIKTQNIIHKIYRKENCKLNQMRQNQKIKNYNNT